MMPAYFYMQNSKKPIVVHKVVDQTGFRSLVCGADVKGTPPQLIYIFDYIKDLGAKTIIEEQNYFDRDYLAEFSTFYSVGASGYTNVCRRIHFFSEEISREQFEKASGQRIDAETPQDAAAELRTLRKSYLGFSVIRPIPAAPFGRTVLAWYKESREDLPRQTQPSRQYVVHLAGVRLTVESLAWQQQDAAVSACASVGIWTMLHSAAFNDTHSIPTTPEVTRAAHRNISVGSRVFPSLGLRFEQICESIKVLGLSPFIVEGNKQDKDGITDGFSQEKFCSSLSAMIRSGYPCLMLGKVMRKDGGRHVSVIVGFRPPDVTAHKAGDIWFMDDNIKYVYVHDDNIGPSARFEVTMEKDRVVLVPSHPRTGKPDILAYYGKFQPHRMLVAVDSDLRTSADQINHVGFRVAARIYEAWETAIAGLSPKPALPALSIDTSFMKLATFMSTELESILASTPDVLGRVRLELAEQVRPMSLHLGMIRISNETKRLVDVLYDTTDSDVNHPVFATVCYDQNVCGLLKLMARPDRFGPLVEAFPAPTVTPSSAAGSA